MPKVEGSVDPGLVEKGRLLFTKSCDFILGVQKLEGLPEPKYPEVGFIGRSNVGKSTLINALTGRRDLARVSKTPGRTQQLNFFLLAGQLYLVDMPGYGYAQASKKMIKSWQGLIRNYLMTRPPLKRVFILIDSRHGLKDSDREFMKMMDETAVSYQMVLTKADEISKEAQEALLASLVSHSFIALHPDILLTSSEKGWGIEEVKAAVAGLV